MRHGEGKDEARNLYVYQQMTFEEIAARVGRSEKTVRSWADAGGWRQARGEVVSSRTTTYEKLHTLIDKLTDRMIRDSESDVDLSPQSLHALTNLVSATKNLYTYESKAKADGENENGGTQIPLTAEQIAERVREIMGA